MGSIRTTGSKWEPIISKPCAASLPNNSGVHRMNDFHQFRMASRSIRKVVWINKGTSEALRGSSNGQFIATENTSFHPKWLFTKGNRLISGKSRMVKYYNLARMVF